MADVRIEFPEHENRAYVDLIRRSNDLVENGGRILKSLQDSIYKLHEYRFFPLKIKKELLKIGKELKSIQDKYISWNNDCEIYLLNPIFVAASDNTGIVTFQHFIDSLRHRNLKINLYMTLAVQDWNKAWNQMENRWSFNIAIGSFILSFLSFILSLILPLVFKF